MPTPEAPNVGEGSTDEHSGVVSAIQESSAAGSLARNHGVWLPDPPEVFHKFLLFAVNEAYSILQVGSIFVVWRLEIWVPKKGVPPANPSSFCKGNQAFEGTLNLRKYPEFKKHHDQT